MIAMLVEIDGERVVLAGVEDWSILALHVNARRGRDAPNKPAESDDLECSVGGLTEPNAEKLRYHFRWPRIALHVGSTVKVTLIDAEECDAPIKRYRSDVEIQESPFTEEEMRKLRWEDYLELKKEFEGGGDA
jgi:hypothetical protein